MLNAAPASVVEVIVSAGVPATTEIFNVAIAVCAEEAESVAVTPTENVPVAVGTPESVPAVLMRSPDGKLPALIDQL